MGHGKTMTVSQWAKISIHPSRVGWDNHTGGNQNDETYFNPPIPCGMGPLGIDRRGVVIPISIHPSRVGWDV